MESTSKQLTIYDVETEHKNQRSFSYAWLSGIWHWSLIYTFVFVGWHEIQQKYETTH